jgi:hypothetical protein
MCILPNLGPYNLPKHKGTEKIESKKAKNIEIIVVEQLLENKV